MANDDLLEHMRQLQDAMQDQLSKYISEQRRQEEEWMDRYARGEVRMPTLDEMINPPRTIIDVSAMPVDDEPKRIDAGEDET
jgi:hypothetical protein